MTKHAALEYVRQAVARYRTVNERLEAERRELAAVCKQAYAAGVNDREMSEVALGVGYPISRARFQQFRTDKK